MGGFSNLARDLERLSAQPLFQYIITTTTAPPLEAQEEPYLRLTVCGSPAAGRLLGSGSLSESAEAAIAVILGESRFRLEDVHGESRSNREELVGMLERGELRLPVMQRRYVWRTTRVRDMLNSLWRASPCGYDRAYRLRGR
jgi:hypothetical protein